MSTYFIYFLLTKEEVGQGGEDSISNLPPKDEGEFLTIDRGPFFERYGMNKEGMYLFIFYCLAFISYRAVNMLEERSREDRDPNLEMEEDLRLLGID